MPERQTAAKSPAASTTATCATVSSCNPSAGSSVASTDPGSACRCSDASAPMWPSWKAMAGPHASTSREKATRVESVGSGSGPAESSRGSRTLRADGRQERRQRGQQETGMCRGPRPPLRGEHRGGEEEEEERERDERPAHVRLGPDALERQAQVEPRRPVRADPQALVALLADVRLAGVEGVVEDRAPRTGARTLEALVRRARRGADARVRAHGEHRRQRVDRAEIPERAEVAAPALAAPDHRGGDRRREEREQQEPGGPRALGHVEGVLRPDDRAESRR